MSGLQVFSLRNPALSLVQIFNIVQKEHNLFLLSSYMAEMGIEQI